MHRRQPHPHSGAALQPHHFQRFFSLVPDLACICSSDGRFKYLNRAWEEVLGHRVEELLETPLYELVHPDDLERTAAALAGRVGQLNRYRGKDGSYRWFEWNFAPDMAGDEIFAIGRDVTDRVKAEAELEAETVRCRDLDRINEELRKSQELLQAVVDGTSDSIYVKDLQGRYVMCNSRVAELLGISKEEMIGRDDYAIFPAEVAKELRANDRLVAQSGRELTLQETVPDSSGKASVFLVTKGPVRDDRGNVAGIFGISRNITDLVEAEEALLANREQLRSLTVELSLAEERERRRIASELHDEIGQSLALARMKLTDDFCTKRSARCVKAATELGELIEKSIREVRSLTFQISPPLLYEVGLEAAVEWLGEMFQEKHSLRVTVRSESPPMPLDEELSSTLYHCVRELLVNVVKHAEAGRASVTLRGRQSRIEVVVRDDGKGMHFQGGRDKGSGFGLFNMRHRIQHLGGELEITSLPGDGTTVAIRIPLAAKRGCKETGEA